MTAKAFRFPVVERSEAKPGWLDAKSAPVRKVAFATVQPTPQKPRPAAPVQAAPPPESTTAPESGAAPESAPPAAPESQAAPVMAPQLETRAILEQLESELRAEIDAEMEKARAELVALRDELDAEKRTLQEEKARYAQAAVELAAARELAFGEAEEPLLELACGIAEAIVGASLERDPELWTAFATAALESLDDPRDAKLRAGQDAFAMLLDALGAPEVTYRGVRVPIVVDPSLDGLGCVAEAGRSRVDGRLAERLDAVKDALIHERRRAKEAP